MRQEQPPHPERTMTALPAELDPGEGPAAPPPDAPGDEPPAPAAPPALGWTPLRIGLALAWAAALVALAAVCLGGWSLIDLSERRIRFVSAVTHELRTPLAAIKGGVPRVTMVTRLVCARRFSARVPRAGRQVRDRLEASVSRLLAVESNGQLPDGTTHGSRGGAR